ncbi:hypothetical protein AAFN46_12470 [Pseudomonas sp. CAU 1711]|uniref:hypothetical protein n=1 Tax=Pseudomonas sp. CAU 1711 TaxID=3140356 RepID=UPI0032603515
MRRLLCLSLFSLLLTGCASSAKIEGMTVGESQARGNTYSASLQDNLQVGEVKGGQETNPMWTSEIGGAEFQGALKQSLDNAGLLSDNGDAPYVLTANLVRVDQPLFGLDFEVTSSVEYVLVDKASGKELFRETLRTPYTAGVGDAFIAVKRLRLANEGSARENISALLKRLSALNIEAKQVSLNQ